MTTPVNNINPQQQRTYLSASPRFGIIGPVAWQQLGRDTAGLLLPKLAVTRTGKSAVEETVLELGEDIPFYFGPTIGGLYIFGPAVRKLYQLKNNVNLDQIGTAFSKLHGTKAVTSQLVAAKAGTLLATVALASGVEFLVPHVKTFVTAKLFKAKNFESVAGLGKTRNEAENGIDPIEKAKRRTFQVGAIVAGLVAASLLVPKFILRSDKAYQTAQNILKFVDFSSGKTKFDLSKSILGIVAVIGLGGYLDASRSKLEWKENLTRVLGFTIPYMLVGKELVGNAMAWAFQKVAHVKDAAGKVYKIDDHISFLEQKSGLLKGFTDYKRFLNFDQIRSTEDVTKEVQKLKLSPDVIKKLVDLNKSMHNSIWWGSFGFSALVMGVSVCLLTYHQTRVRHKKQKEIEALKNQPPAVAPAAFQGAAYLPYATPKAYGYAVPNAFNGYCQAQ